MDTVEIIFNLLQENNTTAAIVSREADISESLFSHWKRGTQKPAIDAVVKLAKYFNISLEYMLGLSENPYLSDNLTKSETDLIKKYNALDTEGKEAIDGILDFAVKHYKGKI